jgi:hypothetical protein
MKTTIDVATVRDTARTMISRIYPKPSSQKENALRRLEYLKEYDDLIYELTEWCYQKVITIDKLFEFCDEILSHTTIDAKRFNLINRACGGHTVEDAIKIICYAREKGYPWDSNMFYAIIQTYLRLDDNMSVLDVALEKGLVDVAYPNHIGKLSLPLEAGIDRLRAGIDRIISYCEAVGKNKIHWPVGLMRLLGCYGDVESIEKVMERDPDAWDPEATYFAALHDQINVLHYAHEKGYPLSEYILDAAMVHPRCLQMLLEAQKITVPTKHTSRWYIEDLSDMDEESIFHIKKERLMCLDCPQISLEDVNRNIEISMKILEGAH